MKMKREIICSFIVFHLRLSKSDVEFRTTIRQKKNISLLLTFRCATGESEMFHTQLITHNKVNPEFILH